MFICFRPERIPRWLYAVNFSFCNQNWRFKASCQWTLGETQKTGMAELVKAQDLRPCSSSSWVRVPLPVNIIFLYIICSKIWFRASHALLHFSTASIARRFGKITLWCVYIPGVSPYNSSILELWFAGVINFRNCLHKQEHVVPSSSEKGSLGCDSPSIV